MPTRTFSLVILRAVPTKHIYQLKEALRFKKRVSSASVMKELLDATVRALHGLNFEVLPSLSLLVRVGLGLNSTISP